MPKFSRNHTTRSSTSKLYAGGSSELNETRPPTWRDVIKYFYFLKSSCEVSLNEMVKNISNKLIEIWTSISSSLPLIEIKSVEVKLKRLLSDIQKINANQMKPKASLVQNLDKIFDIAKCQCLLLSYPCHHRLVRCTIVNCSMEHIVCTCPPESKVPNEERIYLRDQRERNGNLGRYQMSTSMGKIYKSEAVDNHCSSTFEKQYTATSQELVCQENLSSDCHNEVSRVIHIRLSCCIQVARLTIICISTNLGVFFLQAVKY